MQNCIEDSLKGLLVVDNPNRPKYPINENLGVWGKYMSHSLTFLKVGYTGD